VKINYPSKVLLYEVFILQIKITSYQKTVERIKFTSSSDQHFLLTGSTSTVVEVSYNKHIIHTCMIYSYIRLSIYSILVSLVSRSDILFLFYI